MNTITIELCKEDRQRIDEVVAFLGLIVGELKSRPTTVEVPQVAETNSIADENPATAPIIEEAPTSTPAPVAEPTPEVKPVSLAEFQKAVTLAVSKSAEAKQAVKAIINKYATSVSAVPEDKRAEVIAELEKI